jgi:hypothetical protein
MRHPRSVDDVTNAIAHPALRDGVTEVGAETEEHAFHVGDAVVVYRQPLKDHNAATVQYFIAKLGDIRRNLVEIEISACNVGRRFVPHRFQRTPQHRQMA